MKSFLLSLLICSSAWFFARGYPAQGDDDDDTNNEPPLIICKDQTFAFCGLSICWVYNNVAYCECDIVPYTDSISITLPSVEGNACDINQQGPENGYMVSTFYNAPNVAQPDGTQAIYTCPRGSFGAYAQCDGALCYNSTSNVPNFPFFGNVPNDKIICSCPITYNNGGPAYQVGGVYNPNQPNDDGCDNQVFSSYCQAQETISPNSDLLANGVIIAVGSPAGGPKALGAILAANQSTTVPPAWECSESSPTPSPEGKKGGRKKKKKLMMMNNKREFF